MQNNINDLGAFKKVPCNCLKKMETYIVMEKNLLKALDKLIIEKSILIEYYEAKVANLEKNILNSTMQYEEKIKRFGKTLTDFQIQNNMLRNEMVFAYQKFPVKSDVFSFSGITNKKLSSGTPVIQNFQHNGFTGKELISIERLKYLITSLENYIRDFRSSYKNPSDLIHLTKSFEEICRGVKNLELCYQNSLTNIETISKNLEYLEENV